MDSGTNYYYSFHNLLLPYLQADIKKTPQARGFVYIKEPIVLSLWGTKPQRASLGFTRPRTQEYK